MATTDMHVYKMEGEFFLLSMESGCTPTLPWGLSTPPLIVLWRGGI